MAHSRRRRPLGKASAWGAGEDDSFSTRPANSTQLAPLSVAEFVRIRSVSPNSHEFGYAAGLLLFRGGLDQHVVHEAELLRFVGVEIAVAVGFLLDAGERLAGVAGQDL